MLALRSKVAETDTTRQAMPRKNKRSNKFVDDEADESGPGSRSSSPVRHTPGKKKPRLPSDDGDDEDEQELSEEGLPLPYCQSCSLYHSMFHHTLFVDRSPLGHAALLHEQMMRDEEETQAGWFPLVYAQRENKTRRCCTG